MNKVKPMHGYINITVPEKKFQERKISKGLFVEAIESATQNQRQVYVCERSIRRAEFFAEDRWSLTK